MRRQFVRAFVVLSLAGVFGLAARTAPQGPNEDFGDWVAHQIEAHSQILFGFSHPLESSAIDVQQHVVVVCEVGKRLQFVARVNGAHFGDLRDLDHARLHVMLDADANHHVFDLLDA